MTGLGQDVRHAVRQLRRNPVFAATGALTLALGLVPAAVSLIVAAAALVPPAAPPAPSGWRGSGL